MNTDLSKIYLEYLQTCDIPNLKYVISFADIADHTGKMNFTDKVTGKKYTAKFIVTKEPFSARVYITIVLLGAKFWKIEKEVLKGSHIITSRAQSLYQKLDLIIDIY